MKPEDIKTISELYNRINTDPEVLNEQPNTDLGYRTGRALTNMGRDLVTGTGTSLKNLFTGVPNTAETNPATARQQRRLSNIGRYLQTGQLPSNKTEPKPDPKVKAQIDKNTKDRQTMNPQDYFGTGTKSTTPEKSGGLTPAQKAQVLAKQRAETDAAMKGDPRVAKSTPTTSPRPTTPARPTAVAKPKQTAQQKKDAATNAEYDRLRKTDPKAAAEYGKKMAQQKFGNQLKPKTANPLMKDMPGRNKAELETLRGNAAINSISKSPSAKKILNTSKIGQASLNRSQFGSATKPAPTPKPSTSVSGTFKPVPGAPKPLPIKPLTMKNSVDIFDIIKGHLLDEGYAETEESAMVIMTNMSEEWRDSIVELYKGKHGQSEKEYMDSRSDAGKQISGDSKQSGAAYSHRSFKGQGKPAKPGERQTHQGKMTNTDRTELMIRKNALKKEAEAKAMKKEEYVDEGLISTAKNLLGLAKDKDRKVSTKTPMGQAVTGLQRRRQATEKALQMLNQETEVSGELVDENRRAARAAGGYKDDSKKQPDPSKDGFTGIGKMTIKDIMALNKKIEARNAKKEETQVEGEQIDEVLGGQAGDGYIGHPRLGIKNPLAKKQTTTNTAPKNTGLAGRMGNRASQMDAAMKKARGY